MAVFISLDILECVPMLLKDFPPSILNFAYVLMCPCVSMCTWVLDSLELEFQAVREPPDTGAENELGSSCNCWLLAVEPALQ